MPKFQKCFSCAKISNKTKKFRLCDLMTNILIVNYLQSTLKSLHLEFGALLKQPNSVHGPNAERVCSTRTAHDIAENIASYELKLSLSIYLFIVDASGLWGVCMCCAERLHTKADATVFCTCYYLWEIRVFFSLHQIWQAGLVILPPAEWKVKGILMHAAHLHWNSGRAEKRGAIIHPNFTLLHGRFQLV